VSAPARDYICIEVFLRRRPGTGPAALS